MMRRDRAGHWVMVVTLVAVLAACHQPPAEQQIRQAIDAGAKAAEATDAGDFGDIISEDFDGGGGRFNRRRLLGMLRLMHLRGEHLNVVTGPVSVEPRGDRYVATFTVTLGSGHGRLLPSHLGVYSVTTAWRHADGEWLCYNARWKRRL